MGGNRSINCRKHPLVFDAKTEISRKPQFSTEESESKKEACDVNDDDASRGDPSMFSLLAVCSVRLCTILFLLSYSIFSV